MKVFICRTESNTRHRTS